jgi:hypothetical protein
VVLSAGTILTGQKLYPLPVKVLSWDATNKVFITTVDPQVVLQAPTFEPDKYPPTITPNWDENLRSYWEKYIGHGN